MPLLIRNTKELLSPENLKLKLLIYGPSGVGKSLFASTAPNPIVAACETGHGGGLMTVAGNGIDHVLPKNYEELEQFCSGVGFESYDTMVVDGFSYTTDTLVKDKALSIPRAQGNSPKRALGILELDDYQSLAELERKLLARLLSLDKHVIVTCLLDGYQPPQAQPQPRPERLGGPDLPGMMRTGAVAMFDIVMRLTARPALANPKDAKTKYYERVFLTENDGQYLAKSRIRNGNKPVFPNEVVFDVEKNVGNFPWFLAQAQAAYAAQLK